VERGPSSGFTLPIVPEDLKAWLAELKQVATKG
jgi:hypothetical protein